MVTDLSDINEMTRRLLERPLFDALHGAAFFAKPRSRAELDRMWEDHQRLVAIGPVHHPLRRDFLLPGRWGHRHGELVRITPYLRGRGRRKCDCCGD